MNSTDSNNNNIRKFNGLDLLSLETDDGFCPSVKVDAVKVAYIDNPKFPKKQKVRIALSLNLDSRHAMEKLECQLKAMLPAKRQLDPLVSEDGRIFGDMWLSDQHAAKMFKFENGSSVLSFLLEYHNLII